MENVFKDYIEGYVNIHNELVDLDIVDKSAEIERLKRVIEANDLLIQNSMKIEDIDSNDKAKHKEFEITSKQYMENIKNAEKEIELLNKQKEENLKRKEQLEQGKKSIKERAKKYKEEKIKEENERRLDDKLRNKIYEYNAQEYAINQKLMEFKNIALETTKQEIERINLEGELRKVQEERKKVEQQLNQETDLIKKIEKDYILFLGQLSLIDKNNEKILVEKEAKQEETKQEETKQEGTKQEGTKQEGTKQEGTKQEEAKQEETKQEGTKQEGTKQEGTKQEEKQINIKSIIINEGIGNVSVENKNGEKTELSLQTILKEKKDIYKRIDIRNICNEIAEGKIRGLLLQTKVNPAIIKALDNKEAIKEYISCLNEKKELPFELVHNLRDSKLGLFDKIKMWVHAKAEDKIPGTKVNFPSKFWDKNETLEEAQKEEETCDEKFKDIKVDNKDNKIEKKAEEKMKKQEKQLEQKRAKEVKEILNEKVD